MKVSIILPTYNREKTILRSIESVLNQDYTDFELIIIDDGSCDNTSEIIKSVDDPRIRYVWQENQGASAARNHGVALANGPLIAFCDSDDAWRPNKLSKQIEYLKSHEGCGFVYTTYLMHMDGQDLVVPNSSFECLDGDMYKQLLYANTIGAPTILMKKDIFDEVGGFDCEMKSLEDWDFAIKVAKNHEIGFVQDILLDAYDTGNGISHLVGPYYQSRCIMIARYMSDMQQLGILDDVISDLFMRAQSSNVLDSVKKMLMAYLQ